MASWPPRVTEVRGEGTASFSEDADDLVGTELSSRVKWHSIIISHFERTHFRIVWRRVTLDFQIRQWERLWVSMWKIEGFEKRDQLLETPLGGQFYEKRWGLTKLHGWVLPQIATEDTEFL